MSRHPRDYPVVDSYDDRRSDFYRRPRRDREYEDLEVDISRQEYQERPRRAETVVKERDTVVSDRRGERGPRLPEALREDYGKSSTATQLVIREDSDEEVYTRAPRRRGSGETVRSRAPTERVEKEEITFKETDRERGPPYPRSGRSEIDVRERDDEEIIYRERPRSRPPPREREKEEIDIKIQREESRPPPPREAPVEEIRFRRGGGERPERAVEKTEIDIRESSRQPPRRREVVDREEIDIRERRSAAPPRSVVDEEIDIRETRRGPRGREVVKEEIDIRESSRGPHRHRSASRGNLVARKEEEWIVRRPRTPPPQDYEKEEIIIRRKEKSVSPEPEPVREPTPEPPMPPPLEPIYRPPIIQEVITHHRHIDHGVERFRSPSPPPPPPSPPKEVKDEIEIEIKRKGVRNGRAFEEDIKIEEESKEREEPVREVSRRDRRRSVSIVAPRSPSPPRRRYEDEMFAEADYYNRKISSRAYPGEGYNGATRDWGLVDIPPGTERVRMDGVGGGAQEVYWDRYSGSRRGKFIAGDRIYEPEYGNGYRSPPPLPPPPIAPREVREEEKEIKITRTNTHEDKPRRRDKMWTEVTKDLVIKEAIEEMGYSYEETDEHFYVIEYLKYEDVLRLVEITEDIKRERRERIREIHWEREERERLPKMLPAPPPVPAPPRSVYDERIYEREYIYDRDGRRRR